MAREFVIYPDESDKDGKFFSNFYGGVLVRSSDLAEVTERLADIKRKEGLYGEIKWTKVTDQYLQKYILAMDSFFNLVATDLVKVRVMFTNNTFVPVGLTPEQRRNEYHRLYYQFIKHAFGLQYTDQEYRGQKRVRLNLDQMPTNSEETGQFKSYVEGLRRNPQMRRARITFDAQQIAEVSSHDHDLLQCLDVVLGSIAFRLNDKHLAKPSGASQRGKKTIAKEKLYRHILTRIRQIHPNFNVGESTGIQGNRANYWLHPYRHWKFVPKNHTRDWARKKP